MLLWPLTLTIASFYFGTGPYFPGEGGLLEGDILLWPAFPPRILQPPQMYFPVTALFYHNLTRIFIFETVFWHLWLVTITNIFTKLSHQIVFYIDMSIDFVVCFFFRLFTHHSFQVWSVLYSPNFYSLSAQSIKNIFWYSKCQMWLQFTTGSQF